jgi:biopolymer transport protein ExbB
MNMQDLYNSMKALQFGGMMVYPLLLLGVIALAIILDKAFVYLRYVRLPTALMRLLETYRFAWTDLEDQVMSFVPGSYFGRFFRVILNNRANPAWWVESRAGDEAQLIEKALSRGLWVLETIVTAAPLLGLVGTIVGMMESFKLIGGSGLVNPTGVTGGVAQALIATTLGLILALIALFAFNFFSHLQSKTMDEMERLGTCLVDHIRMDEEGREVPRETP